METAVPTKFSEQMPLFIWGTVKSSLCEELLSKRFIFRQTWRRLRQIIRYLLSLIFSWQEL